MGKKNIIKGKPSEEFDGKPDWELYNPLAQPRLIRVSLSDIKIPCWGECGKHKKCGDCIFKRSCKIV